MNKPASTPFFIDVVPYTLHFIKPAETSRGVMTEHRVWYVHVVSKDDPRKEGWGECAPLPGLSCDDSPDYETLLRQFCTDIETSGHVDEGTLRPYPSMLFGIETAFLAYETGSWALFDTPFSKGLSGIPINGLIWMGPIDDMAAQIEHKLKQGSHCIKLKIGSLRFEEELALLSNIRKRFSSDQLILRVDANGAFSPEQAKGRLKLLAELDIHSIEQPIKAGQWEHMAELTAHADVPIALDEELIGVHEQTAKIRLLDTVKPQYLVLKPSLHGGLKGCEEWIRLAEARSIGWWVTSALESNVGLNAIAHWCATLPISLHQGLGTGALYRNNITLPLSVTGEHLWFDPAGISTGIPLTSSVTSTVSPKKPEDSNIQQTITLHGVTYDWENLQRAYAENKLPDGTLTAALMSFLREWFDPAPELLIHTSGSTGTPKRMKVKKTQLLNSARLTCEYFNLKQGDNCLLCLPMEFIAAKMMVVRALVGKLNLCLKEPDGHPFEGPIKEYAFVPLVPLQLYNTLQTTHGKKALSRCKAVLLGGGPISSALESDIKKEPSCIFASYGMAETLSHIAIRRVNGPEASPYYSPLPGVSPYLSLDGCLSIDAPLVCNRMVYTRDRVELLPDRRFRVLGRIDNLILTGGKKVQAEDLESMISGVMPGEYAITSVPDPKYGERIVLVTASPVEISLLQPILPSWQQPRQVVIVQQLPRTVSGKIDRLLLKEMALSDGHTPEA